jgi:hypothetical protein
MPAPEMPDEVAIEAAKLNLTARDLLPIWRRYRDWNLVGAHVANMRWFPQELQQAFNGVDMTNYASVQMVANAIHSVKK